MSPEPPPLWVLRLCNSSFLLVVKQILDIDECLTAGLCGSAECINTVGSYKCSCSNPGYTGLGCDQGRRIYILPVYQKPGSTYSSCQHLDRYLDLPIPKLLETLMTSEDTPCINKCWDINIKIGLFHKNI